MKNFIVLIFVFIIVLSCKKEELTVHPSFESVAGVWKMKDCTKNNVRLFNDAGFSNNYIMFYSTYYFSSRIGNSPNDSYFQGIFEIDNNRINLTNYSIQNSSTSSKFRLEVEELNNSQITLKDTSIEKGITCTWKYVYEKVPNPTTYRISNNIYGTLTFISFYDDGSAFKDFCYHGSIAGKKISADEVFTTRNKISLGIVDTDFYYFTVYPQPISTGKENVVVLADTTTVFSVQKSADISNISLKSVSLKNRGTVREALQKKQL
jgi:hypothetical protein